VLLSFNSLFSNENLVKTSELELFLFKVGFESLLKDVDLTKDKSELNTQEIKSINEKVEFIMSELYKDKRILLNDSNENNISNFDKEELRNLKKEIAYLKNEILKIKEVNLEEKKTLVKNKNIIVKQSIIVEKNKIEKKNLKKIEKKEGIKKMRVATKYLAVYSRMDTDSNVIKKLEHNIIIEITSCTNSGWCRLKDEKHYVRKYLIKEI
jgi:hypothetical protein